MRLTDGVSQTNYDLVWNWSDLEYGGKEPRKGGCDETAQDEP